MITDLPITKEYKVVFYPAFVSSKDAVFEREFPSKVEACAALEAIAAYTLHLHDVSLMPDYSNFGEVLELQDGEWVEI